MKVLQFESPGCINNELKMNTATAKGEHNMSSDSQLIEMQSWMKWGEKKQEEMRSNDLF